MNNNITRAAMYEAITAAGIVLHPCNLDDAAPADDSAMYYMDTDELTSIYADITEEQTTETTETEEEETPATPGEMLKVRNIIMGRGGYRERVLLKAPHTMTHGETWNAAHKVIKILSATPDPDGYHPGCAVDIVTRSIVG